MCVRLCVCLANKLLGSTNTEVVYKKGQCPSNSKGFGPSKNTPRCYRCSPSLLWRGHIFAVVCWGSVIKVKDTNRLDKLIRKAGPVVVALCWSPRRTWRRREHPSPPHQTLQHRCCQERYRLTEITNRVALMTTLAFFFFF